MAKSFSAQIQQFRDKVDKRLTFVLQHSFEQVMEIAQTTKGAGGNLPFEWGFLRGSLVSYVNGSQAGKGEDSYTVAIQGVEWGDEVSSFWTVAYARRMNYGFTGTDSAGRTYSQAGNFYRENAVAGWQQIVHFMASQAQRQIP
jgi:hypothetical protein